MNMSYLLSVLDLYLMKEKDSSLIIEVDNIENLVKVKFCYFKDTVNRTFVKLPKNLFFANLSSFIKKIQGNYLIQSEKFVNNNKKQKYVVSFGEKRELSFVDFTIDELKSIRNNFNNITSDFKFNIQDDIKYDTVLNQNKNTNLILSMGFTNYLTLFISSILVLDIFIISLWVFKAFIK